MSDTSMYDYRPTNVLDVIGGYQNLALNRQKKQANALELQKYQQGLKAQEQAMQDQVMIRNAMSALGPGATIDQRIGALESTGLPVGFTQADALRKAKTEQEKATALTKEQETKKAVEDLKIFNHYINGVVADPRPEVLEAVLSEIEKRTGQPAGAPGVSLRKYANDPEKLREIAHRWALTAEQKIPKEYQGTTGQFDIKGLRDPVTGQEVGQPLVFQQSLTPFQQKQVEHNKEMERLRRIEVNRPSSSSTEVKLAEIVDPANPEQMLKIDVNKWNPQTRTGIVGVAGKEPGAAVRKGKIEQGQQQASDIIDSLRAAYQTLDRNRAIPSTERSGASNLASAIAATPLGQMIGRATGTENQVERDVVNSSRIQLLNAIKQSTGMGAQQLNSNVELQTWLRAVTDPSQSYQAVDRILGNIEKFIASGGKYSERKSQGTVKPSADSDLPPGVRRVP